jgi:hypothetical protein
MKPHADFKEPPVKILSLHSISLLSVTFLTAMAIASFSPPATAQLIGQEFCPLETLSSDNMGTGTYEGTLETDGVTLLAIKADGTEEPEGFLAGTVEIPDYPAGTRVSFAYDVIWQHFKSSGEDMCTTVKQLKEIARFPELMP